MRRIKESYGSCAFGFIGPANRTASFSAVEASGKSILPLQLEPPHFLNFLLLIYIILLVCSYTFSCSLIKGDEHPYHTTVTRPVF